MQNITCESVLLNWFTNTCMDNDNDTVLLIASSLVFNPNEMINSLKKIEQPMACRVDNLSNIKNHIDPFKKFRPNIRFDQNVVNEETNPLAKNLVFFVDHSSVAKIQPLIEICRQNNKKILFAGGYEASQVLNNILNTFNKGNLQPNPLPAYSNFYLDIYSSDPIKLVTNDEFKEHIIEIIEHRIKFALALSLYDIRRDEQIFNKIMRDIKLLKLTNLLTSNLVMHLHHLTFFTSELNGTEAGRYFRDELGIKSKTFGSNSKKLKKILNRPLKNFKAYDLSTNMEKQIRLDIASKLIRFIKSNPNQVFNTDDIAKITKLSEEEVEEIYESYKRPKK